RSVVVAGGRRVGVGDVGGVVAADTTRAHVPVPRLPPPLQPVKTEPAAGLAVSVTVVPLAKLTVQVAPQSIPGGLLVTVPVPMPVVATPSAKGGGKVAVTVAADETLTAHGPAPLQPPPHHPVTP